MILPENLLYCNSLTRYSRLKTRVVNIGDVALGGDNPIRVQSMTTTDTMNTLATVEQSIRMIDAGCEYVRITAPSINEAKNLENIKKELRLRGYKTPLIADIHFTPNAAEYAARIVEKVRVNPGNYADKKKFETLEYTDATYNEELERISSRFIPLIKICKEYGTAMRIGTNHGSLSDRIMSRYGDTALGMVESALEFLRICESENYHSIVLSMKSSNTQVMVQAYRLLIVKMKEYGMNYPLHLGVTEAGEGEDGRIKSAVGIGTLLEDGIGDTVRVSLTEDPEFEIPVAKALVARYANRAGHSFIPEVGSWQLAGGNIEQPQTINSKPETVYSPFQYNRRHTHEIKNIGGKNVPRVIADFSTIENITPKTLFAVGYNYSVQLDKWNLTDQACDYIFVGDHKIDFATPGTLGLIYNYKTWKNLKDKTHAYPFFNADEFLSADEKSDELNFVAVNISTLKKLETLNFKTENNNVVLVFETENTHGMAELRSMFFVLTNARSFEAERSYDLTNAPIIIKRKYVALDESTLQLHAATDIGALLIDGFGDGVWIAPEFPKEEEVTAFPNPKIVNSLAFGILQAARTRISKTEYISCPSCGRTLFDLQETTARIRSRTEHLKGVKIGIMGCIVNGPGEMADADYGYVGVGVGKITLYKGKEVVKRSIDAEHAVDELIELIKQHGDWVEQAAAVEN